MVLRFKGGASPPRQGGASPPEKQRNPISGVAEDGSTVAEGPATVLPPSAGAASSSDVGAPGPSVDDNAAAALVRQDPLLRTTRPLLVRQDPLLRTTRQDPSSSAVGAPGPSVEDNAAAGAPGPSVVGAPGPSVEDNAQHRFGRRNASSVPSSEKASILVANRGRLVPIAKRPGRFVVIDENASGPPERRGLPLHDRTITVEAIASSIGVRTEKYVSKAEREADRNRQRTEGRKPGVPRLARGRDVGGGAPILGDGGGKSSGGGGGKSSGDGGGKPPGIAR